MGADLACDVPRPRARALFAKMDAVREDIPNPNPNPNPEPEPEP